MGYRRQQMKDDLERLLGQSAKVEAEIEEERTHHKELRDALAASDRRLKFLHDYWHQLNREETQLREDLRGSYDE
jgi:chromosome segregation ATPase